MGTLSTLIPMVALDVPGASEPVILDALRQAARNFCSRSCAWRVQLLALNVRACKYCYDLDVILDDDDAAAAGEVARLVAVTLNGRKLDAGSDYALDNEGRLCLALVPASDSPKGMTVLAALQPPVGGAYLPDRIISTRAEALCHGAKFFLARQPNKPWSNSALAIYYEREFGNGVAAANFDAQRGEGTFGDLRVTLQAF
jgi:hypothetical protein